MSLTVPPDAPLSSATAYDGLAVAYDAHWGPFALNWLRWLSLLVIPRVRSRARILDACCGTGQLVAQLSERGFCVVGLDGSREMLRYGRANAPGVPFVQADVRRFGMRPHFDGALCLFDSLNHLLSIDDLSAAFGSFFGCLRPGAWFLFDVNTECGYVRQWNGHRRMAVSGRTVHTWSSYDAGRRLAWFRATISSRNAVGSTDSEVTLWQRCHSHEDILAALVEAGFRTIETYGLEQDALVAGSTEMAERAFYLCRRPLRIRS